jgi:hypothetical protein
LRDQATHVFRFQGGRLQVDPHREPPIDVRISGDPAALLLVLYRRQSPWPHIARGRLVAWAAGPGSPSASPAASTGPKGGGASLGREVLEPDAAQPVTKSMP